MISFPRLSHNIIHNTNGYWSDITSTIDWCETNYQISMYICEFFNTLSSLCILLVAINSYLLHQHFMTASLKITHILLGVVGIGSVAFHMSLKHTAQMMDELPMLWFVLSIFYDLTCCHRNLFLCDRYYVTSSYNRAVATFIIGYGFISSLLIITAATQTLQVFWFHLTFISTGVAVVGIYLLKWWCSDRHVSTEYTQLYSSNAWERREQIIIFGLMCGVGAILCWLLDTHFCEFIQHLPFNPQLHAWWHVLIAISVYCLMILILFRNTPSSKLVLVHRCIPYVLVPNLHIHRYHKQQVHPISLNCCVNV